MATSGTFTGSRGGGSTGPYLKLAWSRIDVDEVNNKSQIRLTLSLVCDYGVYFSSDKTGKLEGTAFTFTSGMSGSGTKTLKTLDKWYTHNSDGSLTTTLDASFDIEITYSGSYVGTLSVSGSADITDIPRASDFTAFTLSNTVLNKDASTTINYTLGRKSTSFSQDMTLKYGSKVIASWNTTGTGALTRTLSAAEANSIITAMSTVTSGNLTLTMQTKSGTTNIGSSKSINEGISLNAAIAPVASALAVSIYGTGKDKTMGLYVQSISKVTASFTAAAGYGATVSSNTIVIRRQSDDANSQTIASNSGTTSNPVTLSGVYEAIATVKDSRGRSHSVTVTFTVTAYSPPSITTFAASRDATTSSNVNATIKATWSPLGTSNPADVTVVSVDNAKVSNTLYNLPGSTAGSMDVTHIYTAQSDASSYTYTLTVKDSFGNTATASVKIGTTFVELTISKGLGVGIGKVHEKGALDVKGDSYVDGYMYGYLGSERVPANADLNNYTKPGMYYSPANVDVATMLNTPNGNAFSLLVEKHAGTKQTLTTYPASVWETFVRNYYGGAWGPWMPVYSGNVYTEAGTGSDQSIPASAYTKGVLSTIYINEGGGTWSGGQYTVPQDGIYYIQAMIGWFSALANKSYHTAIHINDVLGDALRIGYYSGTSTYIVHTGSVTRDLVKGDKIDIRVHQNNTAAQNLSTQWMKILKIR